MVSEDRSDGDPLRRSPLWVKWLLVLSLSLNLVIAGLFVGDWLRGNGFGGANWLERRILSALPEDRHEDALAVFGERAAEMSELRAMRDALREEAAEILAAPEYDPEALLAVFDKRQLASSAFFAIYYERVAALATDLSPEERQALAEGLLRRRR